MPMRAERPNEMMKLGAFLSGPAYQPQPALYDRPATHRNDSHSPRSEPCCSPWPSVGATGRSRHCWRRDTHWSEITGNFVRLGAASPGFPDQAN